MALVPYSAIEHTKNLIRLTIEEDDLNNLRTRAQDVPLLSGLAFDNVSFLLVQFSQAGEQSSQVSQTLRALAVEGVKSK